MQFKKGIVLFLMPLLLGVEAWAEGYPPFRLGLSTQVVSAGFDISPKPPGDASYKLTYRPAQATYVGVILGYQWLGGTLAFSVPASAEKRALEGTSKYQDYRLSYYKKSWGIETVYHRFTGYVIENSDVLSSATLAGNTYYKIPELEALGYGVNFFYVTNPGRYSLAAAMDQSEMQKGSGGSSVITGSVRVQSVENSSPLVPEEAQYRFGADQELRAVSGAYAGAAYGYGYNWVPGAFFLAGLATIGLGFQNTQYWLDEQRLSNSAPSVNLHIRLGSGINSRRFFLTGNIAADFVGLGTKTVDVGGSQFSLTVAVGSRF